MLGVLTITMTNAIFVLIDAVRAAVVALLGIAIGSVMCDCFC